MDIQAIKATIDQCILTGCCGGLAGIGLFALVRWACRVPGRVRLLAKRFGWGTVAMLLGLAAWATYNGTPTQDDKDDYAEREQGESSTNSVLGAMLVPGGMWKSENEKLGHAEALTGGGGALASSDKELNSELLQIVENGGLTTAVFYVCGSVSAWC